MNLLAYHTTGLALKVLSAFTKARVSLHNADALPAGGTIFVINHFTRLETLLLPYHLSKVLDKPVWSLASDEFFTGLLGRYLDQVGAVSVADPERDKLIIKSLVGESAAWIIFPEGRMVKNRKVIDRGSFTIVDESGRHAPHTGAAALALKAEILRQRWLLLKEVNPDQDDPLLDSFDISPTTDMSTPIKIIPVNVTYYPLRSADNLLQRFSNMLEEKISRRLLEEILVEGSMLLDGVDIDIRFGQPFLVEPLVRKIFSGKIPELVSDHQSRFAIRKLTNGLMAAIYNQTTVNLDHILASLLYKTRGAAFSETDLRRRIFMAVTSAHLQPLYFRHHSLENSQIDLLLAETGDRVSELLEFAREKGLLREADSGKMIFKDPEGACDGHAFHRIRVENPFQVIANTVEPLQVLQKLLQSLNRFPGWYLQRITARRLLKIMELEYLKDRKGLEGETKICSFACGRLYRRKKFRARAGIILIHDWLQTPLSLKPLADYLKTCGFTVLVPRLPGHATSAADLEIRSFEEWQSAVDEAYAYMAMASPQVVLCGVGKSAALALSLAARGHEIAALIALFPGTTDIAEAGEPQPEDQTEAQIDDSNSVMTDLSHCDHSYPDIPAASQSQIKKMLTQVLKNLEAVNTPTLIIHEKSTGKSDQQQLQKYFTKISSPEKELLLLPAADPVALTRKDNHGGQALVDFIRRNLY